MRISSLLDIPSNAAIWRLGINNLNLNLNLSNGQIRQSVGVDMVNEVTLIYPSGEGMPSGVVVAIDYKKVMNAQMSESIIATGAWLPSSNCSVRLHICIPHRILCV